MPAIELHAGALRLALRPDMGASIAGLWCAGTPVLRSVEAAALASPRAAACFALLPYSNRLGFRRFRWRGVEYTTAANFTGSPHSLHGVGWLRAWQVLECSARAATLCYQHTPDAHWPFAFAARQHMALHENQLRLHLALRNTDTRPQPAGLGWHPYFARRTHSHLCMQTQYQWELDPQQLPQSKIKNIEINEKINHLSYDHCFSGWNGAARITDECFTLRLQSSLRHAVVFTPAGRDFFCVEPVSHVTDAIHMPDPAAHGLLALAPGAACAADMVLTIEKAA